MSPLWIKRHPSASLTAPAQALARAEAPGGSAPVASTSAALDPRVTIDPPSSCTDPQ
jgi:hypothetical protein